MLLRSYIIGAAQDALSVEETPQEQVGAPVVAPTDVSPFADEVLRQIEFHKDKALNVQDFEGFMGLLDVLVAELNLDPIKGRTDLAGVLNRYRKGANLSLF